MRVRADRSDVGRFFGALAMVVAGIGLFAPVSATASDDVRGNAVAIDSSGRTVVAGSIANRRVNAPVVGVVLARYQPDGSLDPSFGHKGRVTTANGPDNGYGASDAAIDSAGRIVVLRSGYSPSTPFEQPSAYGGYLARYLPDGSLDKSFGSGGRTALFDTDYPKALAIDSQGRIVVGGSGGCATNTGYCQGWTLARYRVDGLLDKTFSGNGYVGQDLGPYSGLNDLAIDHAGRIAVEGFGDSDSVFARYTPDGSLDSTFGSEGLAYDGLGTSLAIDSTNRLLAAGGAGFAYVVRMSATGELDQGFGHGGFTTPLSENAYAIAIESTGRIVIAGHDGPNFDFALAGLDTNGSLDPAFGNAGQVTTRFDGLHSYAVSLAIDSADRIAAAGSAWASPGTTCCTSFALARYTPTGALDSSFGTGGKVTTTHFPPDTAITNATIQSHKRTARFEFSAVGERSRFKCRLLSQVHPDRTFQPCSSPRVYTGLGSRSYTFQVRAVGSLGPDPTPAQRIFTIK